MSDQIPPIPEQPPTAPRAVRNPWKIATFCLSGALLVTSAALGYTIADDKSSSAGTAADPSPSIWQDDRPRINPEPVNPEPVEPEPSSPSPSAGFKLGEEARSGGAVVTVKKVRETDSIVMAGATKKAGSGAKYVVLETVVFNDTKASMDLTCSLPIINKLLDKEDRRYDTIDDLYEVAGNPECNEQLQPGFRSKMLFVYRVPESAKITSWEFSEFDLTSDHEPSVVQLKGITA
ncbi:hypothetical protein ABZ714_25670 [Streptomyces sp. NPDC006798]|uniref:hypothetical protein n=1 Tax=Streptomyces sp. NPDC006798 TaxID=3155462 RepID=UPI0033CEA222